MNMNRSHDDAIVANVTEHDVVTGKGRPRREAGNGSYRTLVEKNKVLYAICLKDKQKITRGIVSAVQSFGGRFLYVDKQAGTYHVLPDEKIYDTVAQALRGGQTQIRQRIYAEEKCRGTPREPTQFFPAASYTSYSTYILGSLWQKHPLKLTEDVLELLRLSKMIESGIEGGTEKPSYKDTRRSSIDSAATASTFKTTNVSSMNDLPVKECPLVRFGLKQAVEETSAKEENSTSQSMKELMNESTKRPSNVWVRSLNIPNSGDNFEPIDFTNNSANEHEVETEISSMKITNNENDSLSSGQHSGSSMSWTQDSNFQAELRDGIATGAHLTAQDIFSLPRRVNRRVNNNDVLRDSLKSLGSLCTMTSSLLGDVLTDDFFSLDLE